jgi:protein Tex
VTRRALAELSQVTPEAFEHAAGFLRVKGGEHPLDDTAVHPERYAVLEAMAARHGKTVADLRGAGAALVREAPELEQQLGPLTKADVAQALEEAGRDPRPAFVPFAFRDDVRSLDQLKPGMVCPGLVTNVTSFGVFVDVGAQHDGLVHVSQLGTARGTGSAQALQPGDRVEVRVLKVDLEKKQVSFTMRPPPQRKPGPPRKPPVRPSARRPSPANAAAQPKGESAPSRSAQGERPKPERPRPSAGRPRPSAERPRRRDAPPPAAGAPARERPAAERRPEPRRQAFNNPFAVLAELKKTGKG